MKRLQAQLADNEAWVRRVVHAFFCHDRNSLDFNERRVVYKTLAESHRALAVG
jgi:hypothetical protein